MSTNLQMAVESKFKFVNDSFLAHWGKKKGGIRWSELLWIQSPLECPCQPHQEEESIQRKKLSTKS